MTQDDAILVTEDGTVITINLPANPENFAEFAAAVLRCTTLEALDLADGITLWSDEDGPGGPTTPSSTASPTGTGSRTTSVAPC